MAKDEYVREMERFKSNYVDDDALSSYKEKFRRYVEM
jgi:hypothetical protein